MNIELLDKLIGKLNGSISEIIEDEASKYLKDKEISDFDEEWLKDDISICMDGNNTLFELRKLRDEIIFLKVKEYKIQAEKRSQKEAAVKACFIPPNHLNNIGE